MLSKHTDMLDISNPVYIHSHPIGNTHETIDIIDDLQSGG
jgi:hypothetical protein